MEVYWILLLAAGALADRPAIDEKCSHSISAGRYQRNVSFECAITSKERVQVYFEYFRKLLNNQTEKMTILPADVNRWADYHYQANLHEDGERNVYRVSLNMPMVFPQMFTKYTLYARNSEGDVSHVFELREDPEKSVIAPSRASQLLVGVPAVFTFATTVITLHQL